MLGPSKRLRLWNIWRLQPIIRIPISPPRHSCQIIIICKKGATGQFHFNPQAPNSPFKIFQYHFSFNTSTIHLNYCFSKFFHFFYHTSFQFGNLRIHLLGSQKLRAGAGRRAIAIRSALGHHNLLFIRGVIHLRTARIKLLSAGRRAAATLGRQYGCLVV